MDINRIGKADDLGSVQREEEKPGAQNSSPSGIAAVSDDIEAPTPNLITEGFNQVQDTSSPEQAPNLNNILTRFKEQFVKLADQGTLPADDLKGSKANPSFPVNQLQSHFENLFPQLTGLLSDGSAAPTEVTGVPVEEVATAFNDFLKAWDQFAAGDHPVESWARADQMLLDVIMALQQNPPDVQKANDLTEELKNLP